VGCGELLKKALKYAIGERDLSLLVNKLSGREYYIIVAALKSA